MKPEAVNPESTIELLEKEPWLFDFHMAMRLIECAYPDLPRWGQAQHPRQEPLRLGQDPSLSFAPAPIARFKRRGKERPGALRLAFLGLFGSQGGLPLHLTEHARDRQRSVGDKTFAAFVDVFQHRLMVLFHRAWAMGQANVSQDRANDVQFLRFVGSLCGRGVKSAWNRDSVPDHAKVQFVGRLAAATRNPEGLEAMVCNYFDVPGEVESFVGSWVSLPEGNRWRLGVGTGSLASGTLVGARRFERTHKFRVCLGPLDRADFESFLPGTERLQVLSDLVRSYAGDEFLWDLKLVLRPEARPTMRLGRTGRIGYDSWLATTSATASGDHFVIVDPPQPEQS